MVFRLTEGFFTFKKAVQSSYNKNEFMRGENVEKDK